MTPENEEKLGRELLKVLEDLNELIPKAKSKDLEELKKRRKKLLEEIGRLVDANLDSASKEYREATAALTEASGTIKRAIREMESLAKAIKVLGNALELMAKVKGGA